MSTLGFCERERIADRAPGFRSKSCSEGVAGIFPSHRWTIKSTSDSVGPFAVVQDASSHGTVLPPHGREKACEVLQN